VKKAQLFAMDLVVAMITFLFVIIAAFYTHDYAFEQIYLWEERVDLLRVNHYLAGALLENPGIPGDWYRINESDFNGGNISSLGLSISGSVNDTQTKMSSTSLMNSGLDMIDSDKLDRLVELNDTHYNEFKNILGVVGPSYDFNIEFRTWNGTGYASLHKLGTWPKENIPHRTRIDRMVLVDDTWTNVIFLVWKACLVDPC